MVKRECFKWIETIIQYESEEEARMSEQRSALVNVIIFTSPDCATCKPVLKHLKRIVNLVEPGTVVLTKIDTTENPSLASQFNVRQVPYVYYNDKLVLTPQQAASFVSFESTYSSQLFGNVEQGDNFFNQQNDFTTADQRINPFSGLGTSGDLGAQLTQAQNDLFNHLFNQLIEAVAEAEEEDQRQWHKLSLLSIIERSIQVDGMAMGNVPIRPTIGDYVHVGVLQAVVASILSINPRSRQYMYEAGKLSGRFGTAQSWLRKHYPELDGSAGYKELVSSFLKGLDAYYGPKREGSDLVSAKIRYRFEKRNKLRLLVYESAYATRLPPLGEPLCYHLAGEISGLSEIILGKTAKVIETKCWGLGHTHCEFEIYLDSEDNKNIQMPWEKESRTEEPMFGLDDRLKFELAISSITKHKYLSVLYKKVLRPKIGDYVHISVLQRALNGIKFSEALNSALLFYAGVDYGHILGDGGHSLQIIRERHRIEKDIPVEFEDAVRILLLNLNSPTVLLEREHGDVVIEHMDDESAVLRIYECASASGVDLTSITPRTFNKGAAQGLSARPKAICDFTAGMLKGRLDLFSEDEVEVKEISCHSMGKPYCEFEITLD